MTAVRMEQDVLPHTAPATAPAHPAWTVTSRQRDPQVFAGLRGDDVDDWLDSYNRVSAFNRWDDSMKLLNVVFYLTDVAKTWFLNHEDDLTDWGAFTQQLRQIFGTSASRSESAMKKLSQRLQHAGETYTSYIEDVLALCRRANKDMPESDKVRHILKGISTLAFNALAVQNPTSVRDVTTICQRLDELQSGRLQPDSPPAHLPPDADLRALIRGIIREELQAQKTYAFSSDQPIVSGPNLRDLVKEELRLMASVQPADQAVPQHVAQYADTGSRQTHPVLSPPSASAHSHLAALSATVPESYYPPWRSPRPTCFYCGIRGHIARFCRRRQQDERAGVATDRNNFRPPYNYRQRAYPSPPRRFSSPPDSLDVPRSSHTSRRRSPSPYRNRTVSPLRPVSHVADSRPEN